MGIDPRSRDYELSALLQNSEYLYNYFRVCTGPGNPGKSWNFRKSFSMPGKSWNSDTGPENRAPMVLKNLKKVGNLF